MKAYEKLAQLYKKEWGKESIRYADLVSSLINKYGIEAKFILDVACGTGILAAELKKMNFDVSGIDLSEDMISIAKENSSEVDFQVADMRDFKLSRKFDIITCAFDSINYITNNEDMKDTVDNIYNHLSDNGYFIFDINTPYLYEDRHFGTIDRVYDDIKFKQILDYDRTSRIGKTTFDFGNNEREIHIQKAYTVKEMDEFLLKAGFKIVDRYKNFRLEPIENRSYKVFYIVRRP